MLTEEEVGWLADALADHAYTYPDSFCECGAYVQGHTDWQAHIATVETPVVERIVAARVEGLLLTMPPDVTIAEVLQAFAPLRAAEGPAESPGHTATGSSPQAAHAPAEPARDATQPEPPTGKRVTIVPGAVSPTPPNRKPR